MPRYTITCACCGVTASRSGGQALFCLSCARKQPRIAAEGRVRNGVYKPLMLDGKWSCIDCRAPITRHLGGARKMRPPLRCDACGRKRAAAMDQVRGRCAGAVAKAIASGQLDRPTKFACVDCGKPATQYDHRDYTKPLDVVPVCRSCNVMRGPADVWGVDVSLFPSDAGARQAA